MFERIPLPPTFELVRMVNRSLPLLDKGVTVDSPPKVASRVSLRGDFTSERLDYYLFVFHPVTSKKTCVFPDGVEAVYKSTHEPNNSDHLILEALNTAYEHRPFRLPDLDEDWVEEVRIELMRTRMGLPISTRYEADSFSLYLNRKQNSLAYLAGLFDISLARVQDKHRRYQANVAAQQEQASAA